MKPKKVWSPNRYIISALRRIWRWSPERKKIKDDTRICVICGKKLKREQVKVDHINPVGKQPIGFKGWDDYIAKMFSPASNLQGICKECHRIKTAKERRERKVINNAKT